MARPDPAVRPAESPLFGLYLANFAAGFGVAMLSTFIPVYARLYEAHPLWIGMFTTGFAAAGTVTLFPAGWLADRWGQRRVLLGGLLVTLGSTAAFLLVRDVESLTLARVLQGVGTTAAGLTCLSLIGDLAPRDARGKLLGTMNAVESLSSVLGAMAGGWLYLRYGFGLPYGLLMGLTLLAAVLVRRQTPEGTTRFSGFTYRAIVRSRRIQAVVAYRFLFSFGKNLIRTYLPIHAGLVLAMDSFQVGTIIAAERLMNMVTQRFGGTLADRYGRLPVVTLGTAAYAAVVLLLPYQDAFLALVVINGLLGLTDAVRVPAEMAFFADEGKALGIASTFSVRAAIYRPGAALAPILGGALLAFSGIRAVFLAAIGFALLALAALLVVLLRQAGESGPAPGRWLAVFERDS